MNSSTIIYNQFQDENFNGKVTFITNEFIYIGDIKQSKFDGNGRLQYNNGNLYEGDFLDGKFHGYGKLIEKKENNDTVTSEGSFVNGEKHGSFKEYYSSDDRYLTCIYENGIKNGPFTIISNTLNAKSTGQFKNDRIHGISYMEKDGKKSTYEFKNGYLFQEIGRCYYLALDTETTGVYTRNGEKPRLVQLAYIGYNRNRKQILEGNFIIKPSGFTIPQKAYEIHGISTDYALSNGKELKKVLIELQNVLQKTDLIVGHNISFDIRVLYDEFVRENIETNIKKIETKCTDEYGRKFLEEQKEYFEKEHYPPVWYDDYTISHPVSLSFLYEEFMGKPLENSHDAYFDAKAAFECFLEIEERERKLYKMKQDDYDDWADDMLANYR